jgi:hypothetical protein
VRLSKEYLTGRRAEPTRSSGSSIKSALSEDRKFLVQLKALVGKPLARRARSRTSAAGLKDLMEETLNTATTDGADSDYYERHAPCGVETTGGIKGRKAKVSDALRDPAKVKQYVHGTNLATDWKLGSPIAWKGQWKGKSYVDEGTVLESSLRSS